MNKKNRKRKCLKEWRRRNRQLNNILEDTLTSDSKENSSSSENNINEYPLTQDDIVFIDYTNQTDIELSSEISPESSSNNSILNSDADNPLALSEDEPQEPAISEELAKWILKLKITRTASNDLLLILRQHGHHELPKCTRTILHTLRNVASERCGGDYSYMGIARGLRRSLATKPNYVFKDGAIYLLVNVDGLPLYKSSGVQTWPILCRLDQLTPFIVAVFVGTSKPTNSDDFMHDFLTEYQQLRENGFEHDGNTITFDIKAFVCDAPARQFLKSIKAHNGYDWCERCIVEGVSKSSRMMFSDMSCQPRDDESFKNGAYMGTHQTLESCFRESGIKCVTEFSLDYMHLVCLGVVKRILLTWIEGPRHLKLAPRQIKQISDNLKQLQGTFPSEFSRQPRSLYHAKRWKATEFRQFLLYTGIVVLNYVLSPPVYKHFLCLSVAVSVLLEQNGEVRNGFLNYSRDLLRHFVSSCPEIYGPIFTVYNVHSFIHLWEDCQIFDCSLDEISCFPFENHLQIIKKYVRKTDNPLAQIVKRVSELENVSMSPVVQKDIKTKISKLHKDSWFLLKTG